MNSRAKGCRGELEAAKFLTARGIKARRGQQFAGGADSPDIVLDGPLSDRLHIEVKRTERGNPYDWMAQASRDGGSKVPAVLHRRNDCEWLAIMRAEDFVELLCCSDFLTQKQQNQNQ